jgi:peptidoglycan biosynthesis protein MviN/MurJ (putative lipid II flippase)
MVSTVLSFVIVVAVMSLAVLSLMLLFVFAVERRLTLRPQKVDWGWLLVASLSGVLGIRTILTEHAAHVLWPDVAIRGSQAVVAGVLLIAFSCFAFIFCVRRPRPKTTSNDPAAPH